MALVRVAVGQYHTASDWFLRYAAQLGASGVVINGWQGIPELGDQLPWATADLAAMRERCESHGLRLEAIENIPISLYDKAMLGLAGAEEQIERYCQTIRNLGRAGIEVMGLHWMADDVWRTGMEPIRGGARVEVFDEAALGGPPLTYGREFSETEVWDAFAHFLAVVLPVAEQAGVRLALHPDDPPVAQIGGVPRILRSREGFERALSLADSPYLGLDFCVGTWSEMGPGAIEALRDFGRRGRLIYIHLRDVNGHVPRFTETFLGEGNLDPVEIIATLHEVGFDGFIIDDHVPLLEGDGPWGERGRAHATGYIAGVLAAVQKLTPAASAAGDGDALAERAVAGTSPS